MRKRESNPKTKGGRMPREELFERGFRRRKSGEARVYTRIACSEDTHFSANRELFSGTIKNMSEGGIYVQTRERFTVGQEVIVAGPFGQNKEDVKRFGKIVWHDDGGIAVQFVRRKTPPSRR